MGEPARVRLKLSNGAEFEASGDPDFIRAERGAFLELQQEPAAAQNAAPGASLADWSAIAEAQGGNLQLRAKLKNDKTNKDACLVLLAAAQKLLHLKRPTAAQLARWLRASGYPIGRVDRAIADALQRGEMLASGSRRARRYELTGPGLLKAALLAEQLASTINS